MKHALAIIAAALLATCPAHSETRKIMVDEVWSGTVVVTEEVEVAPGATLTITEGSEVTFDLPASDVVEPLPWVSIKGVLLIEGTKDAPVTINVAGEIGNPKSQDIFTLTEAEGATVKRAHFKGAGWALHIHHTPAVVEESEFVGGYGAIRFNCDDLTIINSSFKGNKVAIRSLGSRGVKIVGNTFAENLTGIFFRTGIEKVIVEDNNFDNVEYDIKLGEGQASDIPAPRNWWTTPPSGGEKIFDGHDSEGVGFVIANDPLKEPAIRRVYLNGDTDKK